MHIGVKGVHVADGRQPIGNQTPKLRIVVHDLVERAGVLTVELVERFPQSFLLALPVLEVDGPVFRFKRRATQYDRADPRPEIAIAPDFP
jgi:hypothetical protein